MTMINEEELDAQLLTRSCAKRLCRHAHRTLVHDQGVIDELYYDYYAWQCDNCGMVLLQDVTQEDLTLTKAAKLDQEAYRRALQCTLSAALGMVEENVDHKAVKFFSMAVKRAGTTNSGRERQFRKAP